MELDHAAHYVLKFVDGFDMRLQYANEFEVASCYAVSHADEMKFSFLGISFITDNIRSEAEG